MIWMKKIIEVDGHEITVEVNGDFEEKFESLVKLYLEDLRKNDAVHVDFKE